MINLQAAFGAQTTTQVLLHLEIPGYYDDDNRPVRGGYGLPIKIRATPIPLGDQEHGTHGKSLKAEPLGERQPAIMKFLSVVKMPINSLVAHGGETYKITREGDYHAAGFWAAVGATDTTADPGVPLPYPEHFTVLYGKREVPVSRMLRERYRAER